MGHFANRLRTVAGRVPRLVVAALLAASLFPVAASAASLPVGTTFTGTITVSGTSYPCTYEVTGANTVQIGNGTNAAIDLHVAGALSIPSSVSYDGDSYAVTSVGRAAFDHCISLTSTGLGTNSTVTTLGPAAFAGCQSLTGDLVLGSAVSSVGPGAFVHTGLSAAYLLAAVPSSVSVGDAAFDFSGSGDYASILYVPSSWDGTTSLTAGSHTYRVSDGNLVIMDPAVLSDIVASRSSAQDASVSFTPSASGTATIVDASGATVWTGTVSAGVPASASLPGIGPAAASFTVRMGSIVYPSSATPTWYNTAAGCSAQVDVPASAYVISFDGNGSGSGSMADEAMTYGVEAALPANAYARDGYAFAGWSTSPDGSGTLYADGQSVRDLAESGTVTLYAQWRADAVVLGGGSTTTTTVTTTTTATPRTGDPAGMPVACLLVASGLALALARRYAVRARESRNG